MCKFLILELLRILNKVSEDSQIRHVQCSLLNQLSHSLVTVGRLLRVIEWVKDAAAHRRGDNSRAREGAIDMFNL